MNASIVKRAQLTPRARPQHRPAKIAARADKEDIYIGKGKYVKDDPSKYPSKDSLSGGWAGGEAGLKQFLDEVSGESSNSSSGKPSGPATKLLDGKDVIYTGKGNYVRDDAKKYPSKTSMTGGFAGGERGVEQYVSDGEVKFDADSRPQNSPLIVALAISSAAVLVSVLWFTISG